MKRPNFGHFAIILFSIAVIVGSCAPDHGASTAKAESPSRFEWYDAGGAGGFGPGGFMIADSKTGREYLLVCRGSDGGVAIIELVPR